MCLVVYPDQSNTTTSKPLLQTPLSCEDIYKRQQDTLIVWNEPQTDVDLALSFQHEAGCEQLWQEIKALQTRTDLPAVSAGSLRDVLHYLHDASVSLRDRVIVALIQQDYVRKLLDVFRQCEDLDMIDELHTLYEIFKLFILLNDTSLFEVLFHDDVFVDVLGVLEYDPCIAPHNRVEHRRLVSTANAFREIVAIRSDELRRKIHQTHRMIYLKEVVLPKALDDATSSSIGSLIFFNQIEIVTSLRDDSEFIQGLFHILCVDLPPTASDEQPASLPIRMHNPDIYDKRYNNRNTPDERLEERLSAMALLQELVALTKCLQVKGRSEFFAVLLRAGLHDCAMKLLEHRNVTLRMSMLDVIIQLFEHDATPWRARVVACLEDEWSLAHLLIELIRSDPATGVRAQAAVALKTLLQTDTGSTSLSMSSGPTATSAFVSFGLDIGMGLTSDHHKWISTSSNNNNLSSITSSTSTSSSTLISNKKWPQPPRKVDPPSPSRAGEVLFTQLSAFVTYFYQSSMAASLLDVLQSGVESEEARLKGEMSLEEADELSQPNELNDTLSIVLELFEFCITSHGQRARAFIQQSLLVETVCQLCKHRHVHIALCAIRFFRSMIDANDSLFTRRIVRANLLSGMFERFELNGASRNLLNSSIIGVVDSIKEQNDKQLVKYVVENFSNIFKDIEYVDTFVLLQQKYEQNEESGKSLRRSSSGDEDNVKVRSLELLKEQIEEEKYFNNNNNDDNEEKNEEKKRKSDDDDDFIPRKSLKKNDQDDESLINNNNFIERKSKKMNFSLKN